VSIDHFGASGKGQEVLHAFGFTPENVAARAAALLDSMEGYDTYDDEEDEG
jgi:transketolase